MPSLADTLRANLAQRPPPAGPPNPPASQPTSTQPDLAPDASPAPPPPDTLLHIPLPLLRTDMHQPRRYLPDDLRHSFQSAQVDARTVVRALLERAQHGDLEAQGYLAGLRDLAESISRVGLQQPLRVSHETSRAGSTLFRIVDGERRFWALTLLDLEAPLSAGRTAAAILHNPTATADDIQRAQWAANLCREDIPAIDLAQAVWRIREDYFTRLAIDPQPYIATFTDRAPALSLSDKALALTQTEVARLTGRTLSERTLYTYLALAERVKPKAAALARAYSLSLRQLNGLTARNEDEQVRALLRIVGKDTPTDDATPGDTLSRTGRPTTVQRGINACISLVSVLQQLSGRNLARISADDRAGLLAELDHAAAQIEQARRRVQSQPSQ